MTYRIWLFFLLFFFSFGLLLHLMLGGTLERLRDDHGRREALRYGDIHEQLQTSYAMLDQMLVSRQGEYQRLHQQALDALAGASGADLTSLQRQLSQSAGFPVDLYLINHQLVVTDTTYAPDQGLDFKYPAFTDVQNFLGLARSEESIIVGPPTLEVVSRNFKIYSYSIRPEGGYLELGFIDPEVSRYFNTFLRQSHAYPDVRVEMYFENWGQLLIPLGAGPDGAIPDKLMALDQQADRVQEDYRVFRQVSAGNEVRRTEQVEGVEVSHYYGELLRQAYVPGLPVRVLSKISFNNKTLAEHEAHFRDLLLYSVILLLAFVLMLMILVRHQLLAPLTALTRAMRQEEAVKPVGPGGLPELRFLAETYNHLRQKNRQQLKELEALSVRDPLTGLFNRRQLEQIFLAELSRAERNGIELAFAMVDVDDFKAYNDLYGHSQGDQVLVQLAGLLRREFRRAGDFVFRLGGEEFGVLVTGVSETSNVRRFEHLRRSVVEAAIPHHGSRIEDWLTLSIGLCRVEPGASRSPRHIMEQADRALYKAKHGGRNRTEVTRVEGQRDNDQLPRNSEEDGVRQLPLRLPG